MESLGCQGGQQGVIEVATLTATHALDWARLPATGRPIQLTVTIVFPWNPAAQKFAGETIYVAR